MLKCVYNVAFACRILSWAKCRTNYYGFSPHTVLMLVSTHSQFIKKEKILYHVHKWECLTNVRCCGLLSSVLGGPVDRMRYSSYAWWLIPFYSGSHWGQGKGILGGMGEAGCVNVYVVCVVSQWPKWWRRLSAKCSPTPLGARRCLAYRSESTTFRKLCASPMRWKSAFFAESCRE